MKKKFSKEALYNEWYKYQKWYHKQKDKDLALSDRSRLMAENFSEYMFYREQASEGLTKSEDVLREVKRRSYKVSVRQLEHLTGEIESWLLGPESSDEQKADFVERFGRELPITEDGKIDTARIVDETLHGQIEPLEMRTGRNHGWYGLLSDMMDYIQTLGGRVSWNS